MTHPRTSPARDKGTRMVSAALAELGQDYTTFGVSNLPEGWNENQPPPELGDNPQVFYHFTSPVHLPAVMRFGIAKGDVPLTPHSGFNAPWLTCDPDFDRQTWIESIPPDRPGARVNRTVRLEVLIPQDDAALRHWPALAKAEGVEPSWYRWIATLGHHPDRSADWYVYLGRIPPEWIQAVTYNTKGLNPSSGRFGGGKSEWPA